MMISKRRGVAIIDGVEHPLDALPPGAAPDIGILRARAQQEVVRLIDAYEAAVKDSVTGPTPKNEELSWGTKQAEAERWLSDQGGPVPVLISEEADETGETYVQVATRIVARGDLMKAVTGRNTGRRRNAFASIEAAETPAAINAAIDVLRAALI
jgi:hypothetical protein